MNGPILHINYTQTNGNPIPDGKCEEYLLNNYERIRDTKQEKQLNVATGNVIDCVRALMVRDVIPYEHIRIYFEGEELSIDANGRMPHWPAGFCDYQENWVSQILSSQLRKNQKPQG